MPVCLANTALARYGDALASDTRSLPILGDAPPTAIGESVRPAAPPARRRRLRVARVAGWRPPGRGRECGRANLRGCKAQTDRWRMGSDREPPPRPGRAASADRA